MRGDAVEPNGSANAFTPPPRLHRASAWSLEGLSVMIHEVDDALRQLIKEHALRGADVEIAFDAPTREWAARRNAPTIDVYLYDIREDVRRKQRGLVNVRDHDGRVLSRREPPRYVKLSYLVTAWTQRPEDEHRLLSALLVGCMRYESMPPGLLSGSLATLGLPVPMTIAQPPPEDRAFADVWTALGGELKPSLDVVVSTPLDAVGEIDVQSLVTAGLQVDVASDGRVGHGVTLHDDGGRSRIAIVRRRVPRP